jgi:hypothetical protein
MAFGMGSGVGTRNPVRQQGVPITSAFHYPIGVLWGLRCLYYFQTMSNLADEVHSLLASARSALDKGDSKAYSEALQAANDKMSEFNEVRDKAEALGCL